ncbi:uncharacterized protein A1O9_01402 [Exophiala aquamarina CBS 119918]|uniref:Xylanolytic transcriptional activator regulatory domain-containing protein n=1 Tax=Exophiala aquamarina CBS 119918 TaxID=1182545 RepID=A0A072PTJ6_9EURO|nr:uncharacterized protein A1O9_01402 [Exophiala aquamarina CBS 119918]KEF63424.1 hypothetical protein A1O9_01402 [Exophiala aquamarina CBS 119918]
MEKAIANIQYVPRGFEALMFAMYSTAVLTLTEDDCKAMLGEGRTALLARHVAGTKAALCRAKFMSSTSIVVLQALVLHILSIRDLYEPRAVWSLTGVAMRIAEGMGMRVDGTFLGLSPFETEIRRRIWWQLNMHDFRAAELTGQAKFRYFGLDETTPKQPANVEDKDLYPSMRQAPPNSTKVTDMIWCMFRSELATFANTQMTKLQKAGKPGFTSEDYTAIDNLKTKDDFINELEDLIETKYLRFCDPSQPLQLMSLVGGRSSMNLIRFIAHHPRRWAKLKEVPDSERQFVWDIVISLLEQYNMMQSSPQLRRFSWNVPYFIQWQAVIHVLDSLRANPMHKDAGKAWQIIDTIYQNNLEMLLRTDRPIFVAVGNLCLKAFNMRIGVGGPPRGQSSCSNQLPVTPEYITKLRGQRDAARTRREAAIAARTGRERQVILDSVQRLSTTDAEDPPHLRPIYQNPTPAVAAPAGTGAQQPSSTANPNSVLAVAANTRTGDDIFWLGDTLGDDYLTAGTADMMELDTDTMLAHDYWVDAPNGEVIDWVQWDGWFGSLSPARGGAPA